jgi:hypothetical protein
MKDSGRIERLLSETLHSALGNAVFRTGDKTLDDLLSVSREKFYDPNATVRQEALQHLWDAWERLKTIEPGAGKQMQVKALLDRMATEPKFRDLLETEAISLTKIGNGFTIRHWETKVAPLELAEHVDYLFHRLFAFVRLALRLTGRGS